MFANISFPLYSCFLLYRVFLAGVGTFSILTWFYCFDIVYFSNMTNPFLFTFSDKKAGIRPEMAIFALICF